MKKNIIQKIKESGLLGRGGACFPVWLKWNSVKSCPSDKKFIVCNASEGEPGVSKDGYILAKYPKEVVEGVKIALETIDNSQAYIYLRKDYYKKFGPKLKRLIKKLPIVLFKKSCGYICGEETTIVSVIEGKGSEPRIKPPFTSEKGISGCPTLVNNVETFYHIARIAEGKYRATKFYSISGDVKKPGVYELPENWTIEKILKETGNFPEFEFFVQSGGAMSGEILISSELKQKPRGQAAIIVYNKKKTNLDKLMKKWADFFNEENCDKCVPCREGTWRIKEMLKAGKLDGKILEDIFFAMEETSFCALGRSVSLPFKSLINKLYGK